MTIVEEQHKSIAEVRQSVDRTTIICTIYKERRELLLKGGYKKPSLNLPKPSRGYGRHLKEDALDSKLNFLAFVNSDIHNPEHAIPTVEYAGVRIMLWKCFSLAELGYFVKNTRQEFSSLPAGKEMP